MSKLRLQSLLLVEEKLLEAKYFVGRMIRCRNPSYFHFELNAFLSAVRSSAFLIQRELARVPGFKTWWTAKEMEMRNDPVMRFFWDLRNYSLKEGRVRLIGYARWSTRLMRSNWDHVFVSGKTEVPETLYGMQVVEACRWELAKMARVVLDCADAFPFHCCPCRALTVEGVRVRDINLDDVDEALGFPRGWTDSGHNPPLELRVSLLQSQLDGVDFAAIEKLAAFRPRRPRLANPNDGLEDSLSARMAAMFAASMETRTT